MESGGENPGGTVDLAALLTCNPAGGHLKAPHKGSRDTGSDFGESLRGYS